jgi:anti-sigma regulatory factor (Ser/Thr protein kinase)
VTILETSLGLLHSALFYRREREYLDGVVPFVLDGLRRAEPVLIAVPARNLDVLRGKLGDASANMTLVDLTELGRNPARIFSLNSGFADDNADLAVRIVSEPVWPGRSSDEYPECVQHEALINAAFGERRVSVLCPYDADRLDADVLTDARTTHPLICRDGTADRSLDYAPDEAFARFHRPLNNDATAVTYTVRAVQDLSPARSFATRYAGWLGLDPEGVANLKLIVTELATNSLQHAGGVCRLAFWKHDGHLVCQAKDRGRLNDALVGRRPPPPEAVTGRGLFLVNTVADLVRIHTGAGGTTIQAYLRLSPPRRTMG